jgi:hypothetical protein
MTKGVKPEGEYIGAFPKEDRLIFLILLILIVISPYIPWPDTPVTPATEASYAAIENVPDNGNILWTTDFVMATWFEMAAPEIALYKHMFTRIKNDGLSLVIVSTEPSPEGFVASQKILAEEVKPADYDAVEGTDFIRLGWIPGYETTLAGLLRDLMDITGGKDYAGNSLDGMPLIEKLKADDGKVGAGDFQLLGYSTSTNPDTFCRQWGTGVGENNAPVTLKDGTESPGAPLIGNMGTASVPWVMPYIEAGVQTSYISGTRGGAEYEILIDEAGLGAAFMAGHSIGHFYGVVLIIVTNAMYLYQRRT